MKRLVFASAVIAAVGAGLMALAPGHLLAQAPAQPAPTPGRGIGPPAVTNLFTVTGTPETKMTPGKAVMWTREQQANAKNDPITAHGCGVARLLAERHFLGDGGCTVGVFDERLPALAKAIDHSIPPAVDRAVRRDHSLCGTEPCSDCR